MDDFEKFYNKALRFLSYRPRSEKEIRDYLKRHSGKEVPYGTSDSRIRFRPCQNDEIEFVIEKVIAKLKEQKFINNEEFAKWWIESRLRYKPRSISLIKRELLQKGVNKELIDGQISNFQFPISNELRNAQKLISKKLPRYKGLDRQKIYEKLGRYLASKGFDWNTIKKAIDPVKS